MQAFAYPNSPYPLRDDLPRTYRTAWQQLAAPGTWWSGAERVALAQETRNALGCEFCARRKAALSPFTPLDGGHTTTTDLSPMAVDVVHRLTTDPSRLTDTWVEEVTAHELSMGQYVEAISVVVTTLCIDAFHRGLGFELEPLPQPEPGQPSRYTPPGLERKTAWVPMIETAGEQEADLWGRAKTAPNVLRALSLVPDAVRSWKELSDAQYIPLAEVQHPAADGGRAISRAQTEFIAARVSALNDCFY